MLVFNDETSNFLFPPHSPLQQPYGICTVNVLFDGFNRSIPLKSFALIKFLKLEPKRMDGQSIFSEAEYSAQILEANPWLPKLSIRLIRVFSQDSLAISRKQMKFKAFQHWARQSVLLQRCEELSKHLSERLEVVNSLRECYLRDVINIKYQLESFLKKDSNKASKISSNLIKETEAIPSVDLRHLALKNLEDSSSFHMQEPVLGSGLQEAVKEYMSNPWEKSMMYRKLRSFEEKKRVIPPSGGGTISLYAPNRYKLYVNYCDKCIGLMTLVKDWNYEVETSLKSRYDVEVAEKKIENLNKFIENLNQIIIQQNDEIQILKKRNQSLESCTSWFEAWDQSKQVAEKELKLQRMAEKWKNIAEMNMAETESVAYTIGIQAEKRANIYQSQINTLTKLLKEETALRIEKENLLKKSEEENQLKANRIITLDSFILRQKTDIQDLKVEVDKLDKGKEQLNNIISALQKELSNTQQLSQKQLDQRNAQLTKMANDLDHVNELKEDLMHKLRDAELREITMNTRIKGLDSALQTMTRKAEVGNMKISRPADIRHISDLTNKLEIATKCISMDVLVLVQHLVEPSPHTCIAPPEYLLEELEDEYDSNSIDSDEIRRRRKKSTFRGLAAAYDHGIHTSKLFSNINAHFGSDGITFGRSSYPQPCRSFKAVAVAVLFIVRWSFAAKGKQYGLLGNYGYQVVLHMAETKSGNLEEKVNDLNQQLLEIVPNLEDMTIQRDVLKEDLEYQRSLNLKLQEEIRDSAHKLKILSDALASGDKSKLIEMERQEKTRIKVLCQSQRTVASMLVNLLVFLRRKISVLLNPRSEISQPPTVAAHTLTTEELHKLKESNVNFEQYNNAILKKVRVGYMTDKFKAAHRDLCLWIRKHKNEKAIYPVKLESMHCSKDGFKSLLEEDFEHVSLLQYHVLNEVYNLERLCSRLRSEKYLAIEDAREMRERCKELQEKESALTLAAFKQVAVNAAKKNKVKATAASSTSSVSSSAVSSVANSQPSAINAQPPQPLQNPISPVPQPQTPSQSQSSAFERQVELIAESNTLRAQIKELERFNKALLVRFNKERVERSAQTDHTGAVGEGIGGGSVYGATSPPLQYSAKKKSTQNVLRQSSRYISIDESSRALEEALHKSSTAYRAEITLLKESESELQQKLSDALYQVTDLRTQVEQLTESKLSLESTLDDVALDYRYIDKQNQLLRVAVKDSYRAHIDEVEKLMSGLAVESDHDGTLTLPNRVLDGSIAKVTTRSYGTQIACAVCALRPTTIPNSDPHSVLESTVPHPTQQHVTATTGLLASGLDHMAGVNPSMDKIRIAKPRFINKDGIKNRLTEGSKTMPYTLHGDSVSLALNESLYTTALQQAPQRRLSSDHQLKSDYLPFGNNMTTSVASTTWSKKRPSTAVRADDSVSDRRRDASITNMKTGNGSNSRFRKLRNIPNQSDSGLNEDVLPVSQMPTSASDGKLTLAKNPITTGTSALSERQFGAMLGKRLTTNAAAYIQQQIMDAPNIKIPKAYDALHPTLTTWTETGTMIKSNQHSQEVVDGEASVNKSIKSGKRPNTAST